MHLNLFIQGVGHHEAAWRHPGTDPRNMMDIGYYQTLAQRGGGGEVRRDLHRRRAGHQRQRRVRPVQQLLRAVHAAGRDRRRHGADRRDRHRIHHLQRALRRSAQVRLAGPGKPRASRVEHRHLRQRAGRAKFRPGRTHAARPALRPSDRVPGGDDRAVGQLGGRRAGRRPRRWRVRGPRQGARHRPPGRASSGWTGRWTSRGRRRAGRCWCRPDRRRTGGSSPHASPRRSTPRRTGWRTPRPSMPT